MLMPSEIVDFHPHMLPDAARLLAERHARDRVMLPELPARFEAPVFARTAIESLLQRPHPSGVAVLEQGRLVGYLIGAMVIEGVWGRSTWIRPAGLALASGQSVERVQDMYAVLGARWVKYGCFAHFAIVPTADLALLQAWYALSFGIEQVHALMSLADYQPGNPALPPDVEIRRAGPADRAILADFSDVIWKHQVQAPVWGIHLPENADEQRRDWSDLAVDEKATIWLAFYRGEPVGMQGYFAAETSPDNLLIPESCVHLSVAGTREIARGKGIGQALTQHGLAHARAGGSAYCEADWRSTNLLAARFWPRQGLRPMAYRLVRRVDPRIAWGHGDV